MYNGSDMKHNNSKFARIRTVNNFASELVGTPVQ